MLSAILSNHLSAFKKIIFLVLVPLLLSGCSGLISTEQPAAVDWITLTAGQTIGQTFVADYDGLAGIYFYLSPQTGGDGEIKLHLRTGPQAVDDLAVSSNTLTPDAVKASGFYGFFIPPQASSNHKYYYAFLEVTGSGNVLVGRAAGDTYLKRGLISECSPRGCPGGFSIKLLTAESHSGSWSRRRNLGWNSPHWYFPVPLTRLGIIYSAMA